MALTKKLMTAGLAALALIATSASAFAAPAYASANVNVRSGPSTQYRVVDTLRRGEPVDVQQCRRGWCYVEKRGADGWVSANYLSRGGHSNRHDRDNWDRHDRSPHWNPRPPRHHQRPHWNPRPHRPGYPSHSGANVCVNGPNGYFCIGN